MMASESIASKRRIVVFDLGGVLIDWNPRYLFRKIAPESPDKIETFLTEVCHSEWNEKQDGGRPFAEAIAEAIALHPEWKDWIHAYWSRWPEMLGGDFPEMVELLRLLKRQGTPCYALTNWSAETFPFGRSRYAFLAEFEGILVSGEEKLKKPDPRIFKLLCERYRFSPSEAVFIDDVLKNAEAAASLGFEAIHHTSPSITIQKIKSLGF